MSTHLAECVLMHIGMTYVILVRTEIRRALKYGGKSQGGCGGMCVGIRPLSFAWAKHTETTSMQIHGRLFEHPPDSQTKRAVLGSNGPHEVWSPSS